MPDVPAEDITENDTQFGTAAAAKEEEADRLAEAGIDPTDVAEGEGHDPRPRAGGKASQGAPPDADR